MDERVHVRDMHAKLNITNVLSSLTHGVVFHQ